MWREGRRSLAAVGYMFTQASLFVPHEVAWCLLGTPVLSSAPEEAWTLRVQNYHGMVLLDWTDPPVIPASIKRHMVAAGEESGATANSHAEDRPVLFSKRTLQRQRVLVGTRNICRAPRSEDASLGAWVWPLRTTRGASPPIVWAGAFVPGVGHVTVTDSGDGDDTPLETTSWFQLGREERGGSPRGALGEDPKALRPTEGVSWSRSLCVECFDSMISWIRRVSSSESGLVHFDPTTRIVSWAASPVTLVPPGDLATRFTTVSSASTRDKRARPQADHAADEAPSAKRFQHDDRVSLAVIVPFRDQPEQNRMAQLHRFAAEMPPFLDKVPNLRRFHIIIVEQSDDGFKFNRGKLLNVGYDLARRDDVGGKPFAPSSSSSSSSSSPLPGSFPPFSAFCLHDVDLLPQTPALGEYYGIQPSAPVHIASVWERYQYEGYCGGIVTLSAETMQRANGYANNFWGWGGEDDDMRFRLGRAGFPTSRFVRPPPTLAGAVEDLEETFIRERGGARAGTSIRHGGRVAWRNQLKWEKLDESRKGGWRTNGLADLKYRVLKVTRLNQYCTVVKVDLLAAECDPDAQRLG